MKKVITFYRESGFEAKDSIDELMKVFKKELPIYFNHQAVLIVELIVEPEDLTDPSQKT